ncbi:MAG: GTP-binding protein [Candidatus Lokiarchaeota archaeon]|nr:GTP-binding protein [Candidatus Lokiarchaeota archaeon]MBD3202263.1 GTP-binding protein [Candidatus Lokiarchaeota archaeon]
MPDKSRKLLKFKIVVTGAKNAGKTSLIRRYSTGKFDKSTLSTIGVDFETKKVKVDDTDILLNIWDFAGEKKFRVLLPSYVSGASGALMLYDITSEESLKDLHEWMSVVSSVPNSPKTKILIEAKIDLEDKRKVKREQGQKFFDKYNFQGNIVGTSAKTGENVEDVFEMLGREILKNSLKRCPNCDNFYPVEQKFCQYCGRKTK